MHQVQTDPEVSRQYHTAEEIRHAFEQKRALWSKGAIIPLDIRKQRLSHLLRVLYREIPRIQEVLKKDFSKHPVETNYSETLCVTAEIKEILRNLDTWVQSRAVPATLGTLNTASWYYHRPKGVVLVMSPWNFPLNLALNPLIAAIAAGNRVIVKPSEYAPATAELVLEIVSEVFPPEEASVILGDQEQGEYLLSLPFHHFFFTGSAHVGSIVLQQAARHLSSVSLELGGKTPTLIHPSADLKHAARQIMWSKFMNNGQICISPDYVMVHESKMGEFLDLARKFIREFYYQQDGTLNDSYCRIISPKHFFRLKYMVEESLSLGARTETDFLHEEKELLIHPLILTGVPLESRLMQEEIFGPILPVLSWKDEEEIYAVTSGLPKPLSAYLFSRDRAFDKRAMERIPAGGFTLNDCLLHYFNPDLPFGGNSGNGTGRYHGYSGFQEFSDISTVTRSLTTWGANRLIMPPLKSWKEKLTRWFIRYL